MIDLYADGRHLHWDPKVGDTVSFLWLPQGVNTPLGKRTTVGQATVSIVGPRAVSVDFDVPGRFLRGRLHRQRINVVYKPWFGKVWRVSAYVARLDF
ncbi:hypothetical protein ACTQV2_00630 [Bifidobacterium thermophilum]|uniref:hypothetical protein n=1 Tax=Bifidobacterium thermophilum TaxID=33905 RepID=UPI003F900D0C